MIKGRFIVVLSKLDNFDLSLFCRFFEPLQGHLVLCKIDSLLLLKFSGHIVYDPLVEIVTTSLVFRWWLNFEYPSPVPARNVEVHPPKSRPVYV